MRFHQINDEDLIELERTLPQLAEALTPHLNPRLKTQLRKVKEVISNVRWGYGPPDEVEIIPAEDRPE